MANCLFYLEKAPSTLAISQPPTSKQISKFVLVGGAFIDIDENFPSKGKLLIYEILGTKLNKVHEENTLGSVNGIATFKDNHKYLVLGINSDIVLYSFNFKAGPEFKLEKL